MFCNNCGKELKGTGNFCTNCGCQINNIDTQENQSPRDKLNADELVNGNSSITTKTDTKKEKKIGNIAVLVTSILLVIFIFGVGGYLYTNGVFQSSNISNPLNIFKSDEKLILGSWEMDTSDYGEGFERLDNLSGAITEITFYSDGTCMVDGIGYGAENGYWSIVDNQLKVAGEMGGMFWNYNGFIASYNLSSNMLTIYDENHSYTYYRSN